MYRAYTLTWLLWQHNAVKCNLCFPLICPGQAQLQVGHCHTIGHTHANRFVAIESSPHPAPPCPVLPRPAPPCPALPRPALPCPILPLKLCFCRAWCAGGISAQWLQRQPGVAGRLQSVVGFLALPGSPGAAEAEWKLASAACLLGFQWQLPCLAGHLPAHSDFVIML